MNQWMNSAFGGDPVKNAFKRIYSTAKRAKHFAGERRITHYLKYAAGNPYNLFTPISQRCHRYDAPNVFIPLNNYTAFFTVAGRRRLDYMHEYRFRDDFKQYVRNNLNGTPVEYNSNYYWTLADYATTLNRYIDGCEASKNRRLKSACAFFYVFYIEFTEFIMNALCGVSPAHQDTVELFAPALRILLENNYE